MTDFRCDACSRALAADTAFCPYCGADRRPAPPEVAPAPSAPPDPVPAASPGEVAAAPVPRESSPAPVAPAPPVAAPLPPSLAPPSDARPRKKNGLGCATPLLVLLLIVLAGVSWCAVRRPPNGGAPVVAGALSAQPIRVSRRWRTVQLPGDAPASARFAVSSDTALRVHAGGQLFSVRPRHPLRLPEDAGDGFDVRAADYVSSEDAARAKAALVTLRGG